MSAKPQTARTIDEYIAGFPEDAQALLHKIRNAIRAAAPQAEETFAYQIPTFRLCGNLVHFAAWKRHVAFYPTSSGIRKFRKELSAYGVSKGTVHFPYDRPIPIALIQKITRYRVKENKAKAAETGK